MAEDKPAPNRLETAKALLDLARQCVIGLVVLVLILYPEAIGGWITKTGITKGKLFGLEWETQLSQTDEALQQSQADTLQLQDQLKAANQQVSDQKKLIEALQSGANAPSSAEIARTVDATSKLVADGQNLIATTQQNAQVAQKALVANSSLVAPEQTAQSASSWAIITGSDTSSAAAQDEIKRATAAGFLTVKLIHSRGVYRTAIIYPDRQSATQALSGVKSKLRPDAYVVSMDKLCPNAQESGNQIECGG